MKTATVSVSTLSAEAMEFFKKSHKGYLPTGDCVTIQIGDESTEYVAFSGKPSTLYGMLRDCGDHWILADWYGYIRIDKETLGMYFDSKDI